MLPPSLSTRVRPLPSISSSADAPEASVRAPRSTTTKVSGGRWRTLSWSSQSSAPRSRSFRPRAPARATSRARRAAKRYRHSRPAARHRRSSTGARGVHHHVHRMDRTPHPADAAAGCPQMTGHAQVAGAGQFDRLARVDLDPAPCQRAGRPWTADAPRAVSGSRRHAAPRDHCSDRPRTTMASRPARPARGPEPVLRRRPSAAQVVAPAAGCPLQPSNRCDRRCHSRRSRC